MDGRGRPPPTIPPMCVVVRPDKMQICARPANLLAASVRSGPIGGDCQLSRAGSSLEFSRVPRKSKSSAEMIVRPAQEESPGDIVRLVNVFVALTHPA